MNKSRQKFDIVTIILELILLHFIGLYVIAVCSFLKVRINGSEMCFSATLST
jgi:hypothetical protein